VAAEKSVAPCRPSPRGHTNACLSGARLVDVLADETQFRGADLRRSDLTRVTFRVPLLDGVDLRQSTLNMFMIQPGRLEQVDVRGALVLPPFAGTMAGRQLVSRGAVAASDAPEHVARLASRPGGDCVLREWTH
jgi:hypothetical protein